MTANRPTQASVSELFTQYLRGQISAREQGLALDVPEGEVTPYEAAPVQPVDPRQAWDGAVAAPRLFAGVDVKTWTVPPEWPALVTAQEPAVALAFCAGHFPQLVRNLQPLRAGDLLALRAHTHRAHLPSGLTQ